MAQTARVTLTLSNIATEEDVNNLREDLTQMEERIMSALSDAVASVKAAVQGVSDRFGAGTDGSSVVADLQAAIEAERARATELAAAEAAEDVEQDAALAEARAATDAALAEISGAVQELGGVTDQLNSIGAAVSDAPDDQPVGEVPVDIPAPDADVQSPPEAETPAEAPADMSGDPVVPTEGVGAGDVPGEGSTPDPSSPGTTDEATSPDGGAPAEVSPEAPADSGTAAGTGPTDASGNPIEAPRL